MSRSNHPVPNERELVALNGGSAKVTRLDQKSPGLVVNDLYDRRILSQTYHRVRVHSHSVRRRPLAFICGGMHFRFLKGLLLESREQRSSRTGFDGETCVQHHYLDTLDGYEQQQWLWRYLPVVLEIPCAPLRQKICPLKSRPDLNEPTS